MTYQDKDGNVVPINKDELVELGHNVFSTAQFASLVSPADVAEIFRLNAAGTPIKEIPHWFGCDSEYTATYSTMRKLLRREKPFDDPLFLKETDKRHIKIVDSKRFKKTSSLSVKPAEQPAPLPDTMCLMHECLDAYRVYEAARDRVLNAGVSKDNLTAWIKLTLELYE